MNSAFTVIKRTKMKNKTFCCVYGCKSAMWKQEGLSFHLFPKEKKFIVRVMNKFGVEENEDARAAWTRVLKMGKKPSNFMRVCSRHFNGSDFCNNGGAALRHRLKATTVPSQNLPKGSHDHKSPVKKSLALLATQRAVRNSRRMLTHNCNTQEDYFPVHDEVLTSTTLPTPEDMAAASALLDLFALPEGKPCTVPPSATTANLFIPTSTSGQQDAWTLVKSDDLFTPFVNRLDSNEKLNTFTSLPSFAVLDLIVSQLSLVIDDKRQHRLTLRERVILVLMKLKLNCSYAVLSVLFGNISAQYCGIVFKQVLMALSIVLKPAIVWPDREEISRNRPKCFDNYPLARVVLDCTEVSVQRPKCLPCRLKLFSHYKGGHTIKWMTGVSPAGLITFVSKPYGGSASDSKIFAQSGILDKLEKDDCIMVDKGFLVDVPCFENGINIIRPSFLRGKVKFTKEEALDNRSISKARVHVERANAKIKVAKFLSNKLEFVHLGLVDEAFTVVCAIANLTAPLLAADKF